MITSTSDCSILIVDDDPDIAFTLQELLEHDGYNVEFVGTGTGALSKTKDRHYNAVILDLGLPDMDGMDVLTRLRSMNESLPIVMISGHGTTSTAVEAIKKGAIDFLDKPFDSTDRLLVTIESALERGRLRDEN